MPDYDHLAVPDIPDYKRIPKPNSAFRSQGKCKVKTLGKDAVQINRETIDLRYVEQLADSEQTTALGYIIKHLESNAIDGKKNLQTLVDTLYQTFDQKRIFQHCTEHKHGTSAQTRNICGIESLSKTKFYRFCLFFN